jgi:ribosomal-protein-alanine N-acetyltransferase
MSEDEAETVISWKYPGEYGFYDMTRDVEDMAELRSGRVRESKYRSVYVDEALVGFFEFAVEDDVVEVGLGLRPDLTGRGLGADFLEAGLGFARERFRPARFQLRVAAFNERAIKVYERAGFVRDMAYVHDFYGAPYDYLVMSRPAS